jgi:3-mercaptopyruvate sulfurtransferase SseA
MNFHPFRFLALTVLLQAVPSGVIPNAQADSNAGAANEMDTLVGAEWLHQHLDDPDLVVLDCTGMVGVDEQGDMRASSGLSNYEAGHIPGASNVSTKLLMDETGRFRPQDELAMLFDGNANDRTITYCGGRVAASANAFMLHRLGFTNVAVYAASLDEWAADPAHPMELVEESGKYDKD